MGIPYHGSTEIVGWMVEVFSLESAGRYFAPSVLAFLQHFVELFWRFRIAGEPACHANNGNVPRSHAELQ